MNTRILLLPLSDTPAGLAALETATLVARIWQARLVGVAVAPDGRDIAPLAGDGLTAAMVDDMVRTAEQAAEERGSRLRQIFADATSGLADAKMMERRGHAEDWVSAMARLADLTVVAHPARQEEEWASDTLHAVLFDSGRPVLIAPKQAPTSLGTRCCVAWNGTAESAAALSAMLPWLARAQAVRVLYGSAYQRRGPSAEEAATYLRCHGIDADLQPFDPLDRDVGAGLLAAAGAFGADLLGMGAYSHSRLRQLILGGVTRHVLENSEIAVLMAH